MSLACWGRRHPWTCMGMRDIAFLCSAAFVRRCTIRIQRWQFLSKASSRKKKVLLFPDFFNLLASARTDDRVMTSCCSIKQSLLWYVIYAPHQIHAISVVLHTPQLKFTTSLLLTKTKPQYCIKQDPKDNSFWVSKLVLSTNNVKSSASLSSTLFTGHKARTVDVNTQGQCLLNTVWLTDNASTNRQVEYAWPEEM